METAKQIAFQVNAVRDDLTLWNARLYFCFFWRLGAHFVCQYQLTMIIPFLRYTVCTGLGLHPLRVCRSVFLKSNFVVPSL